MYSSPAPLGCTYFNIMSHFYASKSSGKENTKRNSKTVKHVVDVPRTKEFDHRTKIEKEFDIVVPEFVSTSLSKMRWNRQVNRVFVDKAVNNIISNKSANERVRTENPGKLAHQAFVVKNNRADVELTAVVELIDRGHKVAFEPCALKLHRKGWLYSVDDHVISKTSNKEFKSLNINKEFYGCRPETQVRAEVTSRERRFERRMKERNLHVVASSLNGNNGEATNADDVSGARRKDKKWYKPLETKDSDLTDVESGSVTSSGSGDTVVVSKKRNAHRGHRKKLLSPEDELFVSNGSIGIFSTRLVYHRKNLKMLILSIFMFCMVSGLTVDTLLNSSERKNHFMFLLCELLSVCISFFEYIWHKSASYSENYSRASVYVFDNLVPIGILLGSIFISVVAFFIYRLVVYCRSFRKLRHEVGGTELSGEIHADRTDYIEIKFYEHEYALKSLGFNAYLKVDVYPNLIKTVLVDLGGLKVEQSTQELLSGYLHQKVREKIKHVDLVILNNTVTAAYQQMCIRKIRMNEGRGDVGHTYSYLTPDII